MHKMQRLVLLLMEVKYMDYATLTDEALTSLVHAGDQKAATFLYEKHVGKIDEILSDKRRKFHLRGYSESDLAQLAALGFLKR